MILLAITYYLLAIPYTIHIYLRDYISPALLFLIAQQMMYFGILQLVDINNEDDPILLVVYLTALIFYVIGTEIAYQQNPIPFKSVEYIRDDELSLWKITCVVTVTVLSIILCMLFFRAVGGNVFVKAINSILNSNESTNITEDRLETYKFVGLGYIYQFRTVLLPLSVCILLAYVKGVYRVLVYPLIPLSVIYLLGTGQRGGFIVFAIVVVSILLFLSKISGYKINRKLKRVMFLTLVVIAVLFSLATIANGRDQSSGGLFAAILKRFTIDNQKCAIAAFRYIRHVPCQWGYDWLMAMRDILPGKNSYTSLSTTIFALLHGGSTRGTSPECIWGSAYYNWRYLGITIYPFILGYCSKRIHLRFLSRNVTRIRTIIYMSMFVYIGVWITSSPVVLFNQGFVSALIYAALLSFDGEKNYSTGIDEI